MCRDEKVSFLVGETPVRWGGCGRMSAVLAPGVIAAANDRSWSATCGKQRQRQGECGCVSSISMMRRGWAVGLFAATTVGCASSGMQNESSDSAADATLVTGRDCAGAEVVCGGNQCVARVQNRCEKPVTCRVAMESLCRDRGGSEGLATAKSSEETILAGNDHKLAAQVQCESNQVLATFGQEVTCY